MVALSSRAISFPIFSSSTVHTSLRLMTARHEPLQVTANGNTFTQYTNTQSLAQTPPLLQNAMIVVVQLAGDHGDAAPPALHNANAYLTPAPLEPAFHNNSIWHILCGPLACLTTSPIQYSCNLLPFSKLTNTSSSSRLYPAPVSLNQSSSPFQTDAIPPPGPPGKSS